MALALGLGLGLALRCCLKQCGAFRLEARGLQGLQCQCPPFATGLVAQVSCIARGVCRSWHCHHVRCENCRPNHSQCGPPGPVCGCCRCGQVQVWEPVPPGLVVGGFVTRSKPVGQPEATWVHQLAFIFGKHKAIVILLWQAESQVLVKGESKHLSLTCRPLPFSSPWHVAPHG